MTKLINRILIALVTWLGIDSAMDNQGKMLAVVDMRTKEITPLHHRATVMRLVGFVWTRRPFQRKPKAEEAIVPLSADGGPSPSEMIAQMGLPGDNEIEGFNRYIDFIHEHVDHGEVDPVVLDHANASNRSLLDLMDIDVTDTDVMRALLFACFSVSAESNKIGNMGFPMPMPYVISDGLAMSFVQTAQAIERGALPDDIIDPDSEA